MASYSDTPKTIPPQRSSLRKREGQTFQVTAVFAREGERTTNGRTYPTILIEDVRDALSGELVADHLWFNAGEIWRRARLRSGDIVQFVARSIEYRTGYWGPSKLIRQYDPPRVDYKLTPPQGLKVIAKNRRQVRPKRSRPDAVALAH